MKAYQYVVVDSAGTCLEDTVAWSAEDSLREFKTKRSFDLESGCCCIVQLIPVPKLGTPGYWYDTLRNQV